jgi:hypothetical protein
LPSQRRAGDHRERKATAPGGLGRSDDPLGGNKYGSSSSRPVIDPAKPSNHWVVVAESAAVKPPASVTGLARDLDVDTDFAWRTLDELTEVRFRPRARSRANDAAAVRVDTEYP